MAESIAKYAAAKREHEKEKLIFEEQGRLSRFETAMAEGRLLEALSVLDSIQAPAADDLRRRLAAAYEICFQSTICFNEGMLKARPRMPCTW